MTFREFAHRVARRLGLGRDDAVRIVAAVRDEIQDLLRDGDELRIPGLGRLYTQWRPPRKFLDRFAAGRGERLVRDVPGRKVIRFAPFQEGTRIVNAEAAPRPTAARRLDVDLDRMPGSPPASVLREAAFLWRAGHRVSGSWGVLRNGEHVIFQRCGRAYVEDIAVLDAVAGYVETLRGDVIRWRGAKQAPVPAPV